MGSKDDRTIAILTSLIVGGVVGAVAALLLAPQSGKRTRAQIAGMAEDLVDDIKGAASNITNKVRTRIG